MGDPGVKSQARSRFIDLLLFPDRRAMTLSSVAAYAQLTHARQIRNDAMSHSSDDQ